MDGGIRIEMIESHVNGRNASAGTIETTERGHEGRGDLVGADHDRGLDRTLVRIETNCILAH
jgi:hypothetical protein